MIPFIKMTDHTFTTTLTMMINGKPTDEKLFLKTVSCIRHHKVKLVPSSLTNLLKNGKDPELENGTQNGPFYS